jgi:hypothetical protein
MKIRREAIGMLKKNEESSTMTLHEASLKYAKNGFVFVFIEQPPMNAIEGNGYVAYLYDKDDDLTPEFCMNLRKAAPSVTHSFTHGYSYYSGTEIGGIEIHD